MKLGEVSDGVNSISFRVALGYSAPSNVENDSKKYNTFVDKTTEVLDYGSRKQQIASFSLVDIEKADFVTLIDYLDDRQGQTVKIEEELSGETIFTESNAYTTYYVKVLSYSADGEQAFSGARQRFSASLEVVFIGQNATDDINADDSSLIDVLIEIDTKRADYEQSGSPGSPTEGERWFDTDDNKLYRYDGSAWIEIYTVANDSASYGFVDGVFYWSLFSDISQDLGATPDTIDQNYVSGYVNKSSFRFPNKDIKLDKGPTIGIKNGFGFDVRNDAPFWDYITSNNISLFNAKITAYLFNKSSGSTYVTKIASGINNTNTFGYTDYTVEAEPKVLNNNPDFNSDLISSTDSNYTDVKSKHLNKPPFVTYGTWEKGALQNVSKDDLVIDVTAGDFTANNTVSQPYINGTQTLDSGLYTKIVVAKEGSNGYLIASSDFTTISNNPNDFALYCVSDTNSASANSGEARPITAITVNGANYEIDISYTFPTDPSSSTITFYIVRKSFMYQFEDPSESTGGFTTPLSVFAYNEEKTDVKEIPSGGFSVTDGGSNRILLSSDESTNIDGVQSYKGFSDVRPLIFEKQLYGYENQYDRYNLGATATYTQSSAPGSPNEGEIWVDTDDGKVYRFTDNAWVEIFVISDYLIPSNNFAKCFVQETVSLAQTGIQDFKGPYGTSSRQKTKATFGAKLTDVLVDESHIHVFKFPVNHSHDASILDKNEVRLCFDFDYMLNYRVNYDNSGTPYEQHPTPFPSKIQIRFKKKDGSYVSDDAGWKKSITQKQMGVGLDTTSFINDMGKVSVNNFPDGDKINGGFSLSNQTPSDLFDFIIVDSDTRANLLSLSSANSSFYATRLLVHDTTNGVFLRSLELYEGTPATVGVGYPQPTTGDKILHLDNSDTDNPVCDLYTLNASGQLDLTTSNYSQTADFKGRDLFDITSLFDGGLNAEWNQVESMELIILTGDYSESSHHKNNDGSFLAYSSPSRNMEFEFAIELNKEPQIYVSDEFGLGDKQLFSAFEGRTVNTALLNVEEILTNSYDLDSIKLSSNTDLFGKRPNWNFRKQFYKSEKSESVLKDILWAMWALAVYYKNDEIVLKSLYYGDYPTANPSITFNDSNIIDGSFKVVKMRNADEIFQKFNLGYDFYPPGHFSSSIDEYFKRKQINRSNPQNAELGLILEQSEALFNNEQELKKDFNYHYEDQSFDDLVKYLVSHFAFNSWQIEFDISLNNVLGGTEIEQMDWVGFTSNFFTNNTTLEGFVTKVQPNIYNGTVRIGLYIPKPPGYRGPFTDPFNDALFLSSRDITGWTSGNGKLNDSGRASTRTIGSYTQKDGGQTSTRSFFD